MGGQVFIQQGSSELWVREEACLRRLCRAPPGGWVTSLPPLLPEPRWAPDSLRKLLDPQGKGQQEKQVASCLHPWGRQTRPMDWRPACPWAGAPGRSWIESCVLRVTVHCDPPTRTLSGQRERWTVRVDRKAEAAQPHGSQGGPWCPQASVSRRMVPSSRMSCKRFHTGIPGPARSVESDFSLSGFS